MVYLDESGIKKTISRESGWVEKGKQLPLVVSGKREKRINVIGGLLNGGLIAPMIFEGNCDKQVINAYFKKVLLPELEAGMVIVLDNASFHKSETLREMVEEHKCRLLFLPPYSPDFNPIEHYWSALKCRIRNIKRHVTDVFQAISIALAS